MRLFLTSSLLCILLWACATTSPQRASPSGVESPRLTLFTSLSRQAELEPCGCTAPLGGLVREENLYSEWKREFPEAILLSGGSTFVPMSPGILKRQHNHHLIKARYLVNAWNEMGLHVLAPSANDLALGLKEMEKIKKIARFKIISANIFHASTKTAVFDRAAEFIIGRKKVLITAVTKPQWESGWTPDPAITVPPAEQALSEVLNQYPDADFIVLISDIPALERNQLLQKFPRVRLAIGSSGPPSHSSLLSLPFGARVLNHFTGSRQISRVTVELTGENPYESEIVDLDSRYEKPQNSLSKLIDEYKATLRSAALEQ